MCPHSGLARYASVVDRIVNRSETINGFSHHPVDLFFARYVACDDTRPHTGIHGLQFIGDNFQPFRIDVDQRQTRTSFRNKCVRNRTTYTRRSSSNQRYPVDVSCNLLEIRAVLTLGVVMVPCPCPPRMFPFRISLSSSLQICPSCNICWTRLRKCTLQRWPNSEDQVLALSLWGKKHTRNRRSRESVHNPHCGWLVSLVTGEDGRLTAPLALTSTSGGRDSPDHIARAFYLGPSNIPEIPPSRSRTSNNSHGLNISSSRSR